jgi:high-affinity iron transporter
MFASALITLREGLEAALIVGVVLVYLRKIGHRERQGGVWVGVTAALVASVTVAIVLRMLGAEFEGRAEKIFEGATMFLAVVILTYMIFWMRYHGHQLRQTLEQEVHAAVSGQQEWALAGLAFFAVFREGVETALFLGAAGFTANGGSILWGGLLGLAIAIALGWLIFNTTAQIPLRSFFDVTSLLLLFFAAGLMAHSVHEFQGAGLLPTFIAPIWDINPILPEQSLVGSFLKALFGYNGNPSLLEAFSYLGYWVVLFGGLRWWLGRVVVPQAVGGS